MIESKLKPKNCNRGQLFRPCWVSSARCNKLWSNQLVDWSSILTKCRWWSLLRRNSNRSNFLQISHCHMQNAWQSCASQVVFRLSSILGAVGLFRSEMRLILTLIWPWFFCRTVSFYLSAVSLSRQRQDLLNFSCWPFSRIFHVTWPICKKFRF